MVERLARSTAGSPLPRWSRQLLLVAAAGAGVWLLGCLGHQATAQAETVSPQPVAPLSAAGFGLASSPVQPVRIVSGGPAGRVGAAVVGLEPAGRDGSIRDMPKRPRVVPGGLLPVPPVGSTLLPPARSSEAGALPAPAGRQVAEAHQPGIGLAVPGLGVVTERVSPHVTVAGTEPAPRPQPLPVPGHGIPSLPAGPTGQAPGSAYSLPLAEPASGLASGPTTGLADPRAVSALGLRQRACLPDTPPG